MCPRPRTRYRLGPQTKTQRYVSIAGNSVSLTVQFRVKLNICTFRMPNREPANWGVADSAVCIFRTILLTTTFIIIVVGDGAERDSLAKCGPTQ